MSDEEPFSDSKDRAATDYFCVTGVWGHPTSTKPPIPAEAEMSGFHLLYPQRRSFPLLRGIQTLLSVQRAGSLILITINLKAIRRNCRNIELLIGFILVTFRS